MNCERVQQSILEIDSLPAAEAAQIREHLASCPLCQKEWAELQETLLKLDAAFPAPTPSPRLKANFYAMLDTHLREQGEESARPFAPRAKRWDRWFEAIWPRRPIFQFASILTLVALGLFIGLKWQRPVAVSPDAAAQLAETQRQLADLRSKVESMNQLVNYSLAQQEPARARLQQVAAQVGQGNEKSLAQLLGALAFDQSTNVRLSALEALYPHSGDKNVRDGVLAALPRESSPLVQVAMIDFLTAAHEREAAPVFQQLTRRPLTDQAVRTAAQRALALL
ncbi:MAG TPA: HEAT repeat domain-containing protein [Opitutaceae bacterium]|nr:HEAT repeat domain-containing protein [Opitutaceae bacterium]